MTISHDVCRLPEPTSYSNLIKIISLKKYQYFSINEDIIQNTLVISGASKKLDEDSDFKRFFSLIEKEKKNFAFNAEHCISVKDVGEKIKKYKPELLIFDCHGDIEDSSLSSYLIINGEKLTNEDIRKYKITAPIIILSACNTIPNYGYINSISQAFIDNGALSVTSTFLPIEIIGSSIFYLRIIRMLNHHIKMKNVLYKNWLEFISYMTRSNLLMEIMFRAVEKNEKKKIKFPENHYEKITSSIMEKLGNFHSREEGFREILNGVKYDKDLIVNLDEIRCESLLYCHIGRPDLIFFNNWLEKKRELNSDNHN